MGSAKGTGEYRLVAWLFLRALALVYLAAFASLGTQILGLAGAQGILPAGAQLEHVAAQLGAERFWRLPTLFWIDASDAALLGAAVAGCALSVAVLLGVLERTNLAALFVLYLSLVQAGQIFTNFQWDYLLLEAGFLAVLLPGGSRIVIWLYRWLLFRLRFLSGAAKLLSQDPSWSGLTALGLYFEVQPLPHAGAWYAHQLPGALLEAATGAALAVELVVPFLMFAPRGPRFVAAWLTIAMQVLILLTSNHNFFNLLTIALCLFLFDDRAVARVLPARIVAWHGARAARAAPSRPGRFAAVALAALVVPASVAQAVELLSGRRLPEGVAAVVAPLRALHVVHAYHVFPTMKTERIELVVEGSADGEHWRPYAFRYKPGALERRPPVVVPHQPRLDWMLWFVPMGHPMNFGWYEGFLRGLLAGSPPVLALLAEDPFPDGPPRYVRAGLYRYRFTDAATRAASGRWWSREYLGPFHPWPWLESPGTPGAP